MKFFREIRLQANHHSIQQNQTSMFSFFGSTCLLIQVQQLKSAWRSLHVGSYRHFPLDPFGIYALYSELKVKVPANLEVLFRKQGARHIRDTNEKNTLELKKDMFDESDEYLPNAWLMRETCERRIEHRLPRFSFGLSPSNNGKWKDGSDFPFVQGSNGGSLHWTAFQEILGRQRPKVATRVPNDVNKCRFTSIPTYFLRFASCQMITGYID